MQRLFVAMVVAAAAALVPAWAMAGNQEVAEQIAASLRESGQLHGYKIGVKFQDGTAWLAGRVSSREQMETAIKLASQTAGVRHVVNHLTVTPVSGGKLRQTGGALGPEQLTRRIAPDLASTSANSRVSRVHSVPASPVASVPRRPAPQAGLPLPERASISSRLSRASRPQVSLPPRPEAEPAPASLAQKPAERALVTAPALSASSKRHAPESARPPALHPLAQPKEAAHKPRPYATAKTERARPARTAAEPAPPARPAASTPVQYMAAPVALVPVAYGQQPMPVASQPMPQYITPVGGGVAPARYDQPHMPNYAWPSYAAYPNYAALTYPKQYSPAAWPYIGPFHPYPQVPLGWRKVVLEWHDGWWQLDFDDGASGDGPISGLFRPFRKR